MTNEKRGKLIVFEGISGLGKSTQKSLIASYLEGLGYKVVQTEWNSDPCVGTIIARSKREKAFSSMTWSMAHATEFLRRYTEIILPALENSNIVLADRYIYTALARDSVRGMDKRDINNIYFFAQKPDLLLYFMGRPEVALERTLQRRNRLSFYGSGMDLEYSTNYEECWLIYQSKIQKEYAAVLDKSILVNIDAEQSYIDVFKDICISLKKIGLG